MNDLSYDLRIRKIKGKKPTISLSLCNVEYIISEAEFSNAVKALGWTPPEPPMGKPELWVEQDTGRICAATRMTYRQLHKMARHTTTHCDMSAMVYNYYGNDSWDHAKYFEQRYRKITPAELSLIKKVLE